MLINIDVRAIVLGREPKGSKLISGKLRSGPVPPDSNPEQDQVVSRQNFASARVSGIN